MTPVAPPEAETPVNADWLDADAHGLRREVVAIQNALAHIENLVRLADFHGETQWSSELSRVAGFTRERRDWREDRARELTMVDR